MGIFAPAVLAITTIASCCLAVAAVDPTYVSPDTQGLNTSNPGAYRVIPERERLIPLSLASNRSRTIQNIITVKSNIQCTGLSATCNCVNSTTPKNYQVILDVDLPCGEGPFPIVWLWHGFGGLFLLNSNSYDVYVNALTDAGFAVIQYDVIQGAIPILVQDAVELQFPIQILDWLKVMSLNSASRFYQKFDFQHIATTGHSRGGKISGYVYGADLLPNVFTYIGIDPVDCACFAPCTSNCYPGAAETFKGTGKTIATIGSTFKGCCNPTQATDPPVCTVQGAPCLGIDYSSFIANAAPDSVNYVSMAGHAQYAQLFPTGNFFGDIVCGGNSSVTPREVQEASAKEVVDWITSRLKAKSDTYANNYIFSQGGCPPTPANTAAPTAATDKMLKTPETSTTPTTSSAGAPEEDGTAAATPTTSSTSTTPRTSTAATPEEEATAAAIAESANITAPEQYSYYSNIPPTVFLESLTRASATNQSIFAEAAKLFDHVGSAAQTDLKYVGNIAASPTGSFALPGAVTTVGMSVAQQLVG